MQVRYWRPADWGMTWTRPPQSETMPDPEVYVHHTAGCHSDDARTALQGLNTYAQQSKGYSALDYDVLVHRDSRNGLITIAEGRGKYLSAATKDRNELGEAVCLLGTFHPTGPTCRRQPHPDEIEGVALAIVWGIENGWMSPTAKILGHRDNPAHLNATTCPGDWLYQYLPSIRKRVADLLAPAPVPVPPVDPSEGAGFMLVAVTVNSGPFYVSNGLRTGALHVPTQAPFEIIGMGAFDVGSKRRVTSWEQCKPVTASEAFALLGSKV